MTIPPAIQAVLDLYTGPLADQRFADIDGATLARLAVEVERATTEMEAHEAQVAAARSDLEQRQESLLAHAQRALAYARVYAETNPELSARLNTIALTRPAKRSRASSSDRESTGAAERDDAARQENIAFDGNPPPKAPVAPRSARRRDSALLGRNAELASEPSA